MLIGPGFRDNLQDNARGLGARGGKTCCSAASKSQDLNKPFEAATVAESITVPLRVSQTSRSLGPSTLRRPQQYLIVRTVEDG